MTKDQIFLSKAARLAAASSRKGEGGPFGSIIVYKGQIIGQGFNTVIKSNDPTRHAEINAIQKASKKLKSPFLKGCIVYTTTEPCPMCFSAIHWAQAAKIIYSTQINDVKKLGFNELPITSALMKRLGQSPVQLKRIKNQDCLNLLALWKSNPKRKTY